MHRPHPNGPLQPTDQQQSWDLGSLCTHDPRCLTHPLRGPQVGTRVHRSLRTRMTMTHDFSPLALA